MRGPKVADITRSEVKYALSKAEPLTNYQILRYVYGIPHKEIANLLARKTAPQNHKLYPQIIKMCVDITNKPG